MTHRKRISYLVGVLLVFVITSPFLNVRAQEEGPNYEMGFDVGTELVWEITELDKSNFKVIFGTIIEINIEKGDQLRIVITGIRELSISRYIITYDFWDYKTNWFLEGEERTLDLFAYPSTYNYTTFIPVPVNNFLEEAALNLTSEYTVIGSTVIKQGISDIGKQYRIEKEYDIRGIVVIETWYDEFNQIFLRSEGTFRISSGIYFIGFMIAGVLGLMILIITKKKYKVKY